MTEQKNYQQNILESILYYWNALLKWKWTGLSVATLVIVITAAIILIFPHVYQARGTIWLEESSNILPFEELNRFSGEITSQSHSMLIKSRALASEVINKLKLNERLEPSTETPTFPANSPQALKAREKLIDVFLKSVNVSPISGTKLIEVTFNHKNPETAAAVLNSLFDSYIDMLVRRKYTASEQATEFLTGQIASLRKDIEESEKKLAELGTSQGILPLSSAEAPLITKITEVNAALTAATLDRVNKLSYYNQLKALKPEELSESPSNPAISRLKEQYALLSREYARRLATLKPEYPEMQKLKSEIEATYEALQNEKENLIKAAYADYLGALAKEQNLQKLLDELKVQAYKANSNTILYNSLRIETENKKALLEALTKRQSETDLASRLKDLQVLNVWIVDRASVPVNPAFPNRKKTLLLGLLAALVAGIASSLFVNHLVAIVRSSKDVIMSTGFPVIGTIPAFEREIKPRHPVEEFRLLINLLRGSPGIPDSRKKSSPPKQISQNFISGKESDHGKEYRIELIVHHQPQSIQAEAFRSIRTTLLMSLPETSKKVLVFSSPLSKDGKSSIVSNIGLTMSLAHRKVVLVDSDLRKPRLPEIFNVDYTWGLTHFLSSIVDASEIIRPTQFNNLFIVPSGVMPSDPIEVILSEKMKALVSYLKQNFDYVLFDSPPIMAVSDALVLSRLADGLVLVVRAGQTPISALKQAKSKIESHKINLLGVIINGVSLLEQDGYYAKQYYNYAKPL
ncbi:MAG: polysaccharide biosynthesis tyrosine autokinase [Candidatus Aminicenantes bacterium]|nr:polysaccharide biosynthesis tyrosine autokinase [Candidatus Aminicenantes bacterium]